MLLPAIGTCGEGAARAVPAIETAAKITLSDVRNAFTIVLSCDAAVAFLAPKEKPGSPSEKGAVSMHEPSQALVSPLGDGATVGLVV